MIYLFAAGYVLVVLIALGLCWAAADGDAQVQRALEERAAKKETEPTWLYDEGVRLP